MKYDYNCVPFSATNCRNVETEHQDECGGNIACLYRHDLKCNQDESIRRVQMKRDEKRWKRK